MQYNGCLHDIRANEAGDSILMLFYTCKWYMEILRYVISHSWHHIPILRTAGNLYDGQQTTVEPPYSEHHWDWPGQVS